MNNKTGDCITCGIFYCRVNAEIKVCSPLKLRSGLTGKKPAICHYSYNLPLAATPKDRR